MMTGEREQQPRQATFCRVNKPVRGRVVAGDLQLVLDGAGDPLRTVDVAGGAVADLDQVFAQRLEAELGVKRDDPVNFGGGDADDLADLVDGRFRDIAVGVLGRLQKGDQGSLFPLIVPQVDLEAGEAVLCLLRFQFVIGLSCPHYRIFWLTFQIV